MPKLLTLAWRDVWRHRRRTFLTMGAILFAVVLISVASSMQTGTYEAMENLVVRLHTSDLQIQHAGFHKERMLEYSLEEGALDVEALKAQHPWITTATRRLTGFGLVSSDSASAGVMIAGIEPDTEPLVSNLLSNVSTPLVSGHPQDVLLGSMLANNLGLSPGDSVVVLTQGYHNVMGADIYVVRGLVRTGTPEIDRSMMVMSLTAAQELLSMPGRYTELVLRTDRHDRARQHAETVQGSLTDSSYVALPWQTLMPDMDQMRRLDDASNYIFYTFLLLLIGFEIFNTTAMSMMERVREFGVMMAMGLKPSQISGLVAMELALKTLMGVGAGLVVASMLIAIVGQEPIALSERMTEMYEDFGFLVDGFYFTSKPSIYTFPVVSVLVMSLVSMLFPVFKMRRYSPVHALRAI